MSKSLVIVESPTKARTISRFLGGDFIIESSYGHIRDLPKSKLGVDTEKDFEPQYVIPTRARKVVNRLKSEAEGAEKIILATDEDREGEAIAWHLVQALGLGNPKPETRNPKPLVERIVFHEITKSAIEGALKNPRSIDLKLVNAQQARRVLDRLVGYKLSPFLWKKVRRGLSAGRVQSVALRLVVEREEEIKKFKSDEYWTIEALLKRSVAEEAFGASLVKIGDKVLEKLAIKNGEEAGRIINELQGADWIVARIEKRAVTRRPLPPFITSTLQQESWRRLRFSAKKTMVIAQQLYEGMELGEAGSTGLITYMRTDSVNLSAESLRGARRTVEELFGKPYALASPRVFKTKSKTAQEAHEAIRPADPAKTPESINKFLSRDQFRLYDLIWRRFMACQMAEALFDATSIDVAAEPRRMERGTTRNYTFRANGQVMHFDGFLKAYPIKTENIVLPELHENDKLVLEKITPLEHHTEPLPRFTEASLIKALEAYGIGRPSTYAPTMSTVQDRGYVEKDEQKRLRPTEIGTVVNSLLVEHFPEIVNIQFTAKMEEELDDIAEGEREWRPVIKEFYEPFAKNIAAKYEEVAKQTPVETTDEVCDKCGKPMVIKYGRFGKFMACSGFPECKNAKALPKEPPKSIGVPCPECKEGEMVERRTRKGRMFYGCSRYPDCKYASWTDPRKKDESGTTEEKPK